MDLALELGMPLSAINQISEQEFKQWELYSAQRKLPTRRLEYALARVAQVSAQAMAGSKAPLSDFMIDFMPAPVQKKRKAKGAAMQSGRALSMISGRGVYVLAQGRKANGAR